MERKFIATEEKLRLNESTFGKEILYTTITISLLVLFLPILIIGYNDTLPPGTAGRLIASDSYTSLIIVSNLLSIIGFACAIICLKSSIKNSSKYLFWSEDYEKIIDLENRLRQEQQQYGRVLMFWAIFALIILVLTALLSGSLFEKNDDSLSISKDFYKFVISIFSFFLIYIIAGVILMKSTIKITAKYYAEECENEDEEEDEIN